MKTTEQPRWRRRLAQAILVTVIALLAHQLNHSRSYDVQLLLHVALEMRGLQPPRLPELSSDLDTRYVEPAADEPVWRPEDADGSTSLSTTALDSGA